MRPLYKPSVILGSLFLSLCLFGCGKETDEITNPPSSVPVVVRGAYTYTLSISASNTTIDVRDSTRWYPHVAYLSLTVSGYSSGTGLLEVVDSSGIRVCIDSISRDMEVLNRKLATAMPLRLRFSLHAFTGTITFGLQLGAMDINGLVARLVLRDSTGVIRPSFKVGEPVEVAYSLLNITGTSHHWGKGDSRPMCRLTILQGDSDVRDSFEGLAFFQMPETGDLHDGDSIHVNWHGITPQRPLLTGHYTVVADPQFLFTDLGFLRSQELSFDIVP